MKKLISSVLKNQTPEPASVKLQEKAIDAVEVHVEKLAKNLKRSIKAVQDSAEEGAAFSNNLENYAYVISQQQPEWALVGQLLHKASNAEVLLDTAKRKMTTGMNDFVFAPWTDLLLKDMILHARDAKTRYDRWSLEPELEAKLILQDVLNRCEYDILSKMCVYFEKARDYHRDSLDVLNKVVPELNAMIADKKSEFEKTQSIQSASLRSNDRYFGEHLSIVCKRERTLVPKFVSKSIEFLSSHLTTEGLFRLSAPKQTTVMLKCLIDEGHEIDFDKWKADAHVVGHLLKQYLRELPDPLLTYEMYSQFLRISANESNMTEDQQIIELHKMVDKLPKLNKRLLRDLVHFLKKMAAEADQSKMNSSNLATVFGPNVLFTKTEDLSNFSNVNKVLELLIHGCYQIFPDDEIEIPDDIEIAASTPKEEKVVKVDPQWVDVPLGATSSDDLDRKTRFATLRMMRKPSKEETPQEPSIVMAETAPAPTQPPTIIEPAPSPSSRPTRPTKKDKKPTDGKRFFSYITIRGKKKEEEEEKHDVSNPSNVLKKVSKWSEMKTETGQVYWYNTVTRETSFKDPNVNATEEAPKEEKSLKSKFTSKLKKDKKRKKRKC